MSKSFNQFIDIFLEGRGRVGDIYQSALPYLEFGAFIFSVILLVAIVILIIRSERLTLWIDEKVDEYRIGSLSQRRNTRAWKRILSKIRSDETDDWKKALEDADKIFGELLRVSGHKGRTIGDRLTQVLPGAIPNLELLKEAHQFREYMAQDKNYPVTHELALKYLGAYRDAFLEMGLID